MIQAKIKYFIYAFGIIVINVFFLKNGLGTNKDAISLDELFAFNHAYAESGDCNNAKETSQGSQLYATAINGQAAISGGVSVGMINDGSLSAEISAQVTWESKDSYQVICYDGAGSACCTTQGWTACASGGCPDAGTTKK